MENVAAENNNTEVSQETQTNQTEGSNATTIGGAQAPVIYDFSASIPEGYELDKAEADRFTAVIKDMGLSNEQANAIAKYGFEWGQGIAAAAENQRREQVKSWGEAMQKELGADYDKSISRAGAAVERIEQLVPNFREFLNETGVGNRVEMARVLNFVADMIESDPGKGVHAPAAKGSLESFYGY